MPKDNIKRAIDKSSIAADSNFESIRYEGFGPSKTAVIVQTLTDNKNRTASSIRTLFQKYGGGLGTQGSASHNFTQQGIIKIDRKEINDEKIFDLAIESGANECISIEEIHEIQTNPDEIEYKYLNEFTKLILRMKLKYLEMPVRNHISLQSIIRK